MLSGLAETLKWELTFVSDGVLCSQRNGQVTYPVQRGSFVTALIINQSLISFQTHDSVIMSVQNSEQRFSLTWKEK